MFDINNNFMMTRFAPLALFFVLLFGCSTSFAQKNIDEAKAAITAARAEYLKAYNADDPIKTAFYYGNTALLMPPNQQKITGRAAIKEYYKTNAQIYSDYFSSTTKVAIEDKTAIETGTYTVTVQLPGATESFIDRGKYVCIWQKGDDDKWRIGYDIYNTDLAPAK